MNFVKPIKCAIKIDLHLFDTIGVFAWGGGGHNTLLLSSPHL